MTTLASASRAYPSTGRTGLARCVVVTVGGRYSSELGIDAGAGDAQVERSFLAAPGAGLPPAPAPGPPPGTSASPPRPSPISHASPGWLPAPRLIPAIWEVGWSGWPWPTTAGECLGAQARTCAPCSRRDMPASD
jgi:hypothetical protein